MTTTQSLYILHYIINQFDLFVLRSKKEGGVLNKVMERVLDEISHEKIADKEFSGGGSVDTGSIYGSYNNDQLSKGDYNEMISRNYASSGNVMHPQYASSNNVMIENYLSGYCVSENIGLNYDVGQNHHQGGHGIEGTIFSARVVCSNCNLPVGGSGSSVSDKEGRTCSCLLGSESMLLYYNEKEMHNKTGLMNSSNGCMETIKESENLLGSMSPQSIMTSMSIATPIYSAGMNKEVMGLRKEDDIISEMGGGGGFVLGATQSSESENAQSFKGMMHPNSSSSAPGSNALSINMSTGILSNVIMNSMSSSIMTGTTNTNTGINSSNHHHNLLLRNNSNNNNSNNNSMASTGGNNVLNDGNVGSSSVCAYANTGGVSVGNIIQNGSLLMSGYLTGTPAQTNSRKILARVRELWLSNIMEGLPRKIAAFILQKHGNQIPYDRQFWSYAYKTGRLHPAEEQVQRQLNEGVQCLNRFIQQLIKSCNIMREHMLRKQTSSIGGGGYSGRSSNEVRGYFGRRGSGGRMGGGHHMMMGGNGVENLEISGKEIKYGNSGGIGGDLGMKSCSIPLISGMMEEVTNGDEIDEAEISGFMNGSMGMTGDGMMTVVGEQNIMLSGNLMGVADGKSRDLEKRLNDGLPLMISERRKNEVPESHLLLGGLSHSDGTGVGVSGGMVVGCNNGLVHDEGNMESGLALDMDGGGDGCNGVGGSNRGGIGGMSNHSGGCNLLLDHGEELEEDEDDDGQIAEIPLDLTDEYLAKWLDGKNALIIRKLVNGDKDVQTIDLPTCLNSDNLYRALRFGGLLVRIPPYNQKSYEHFNLLSPGRGDTRHTQLVIPDGERDIDVKKSRTSLALPEFLVEDIPLPKVCVFQIEAKLELLLLYRGCSSKRPHTKRGRNAAGVNNASIGLSGASGSSVITSGNSGSNSSNSGNSSNSSSSNSSSSCNSSNNSIGSIHPNINMTIPISSPVMSQIPPSIGGSGSSGYSNVSSATNDMLNVGCGASPSFLGSENSGFNSVLSSNGGNVSIVDQLTHSQMILNKIMGGSTRMNDSMLSNHNSMDGGFNLHGKMQLMNGGHQVSVNMGNESDFISRISTLGGSGINEDDIIAGGATAGEGGGATAEGDNKNGNVGIISNMMGGYSYSSPNMMNTIFMDGLQSQMQPNSNAGVGGVYSLSSGSQRADAGGGQTLEYGSNHHQGVSGNSALVCTPTPSTSISTNYSENLLFSAKKKSNKNDDSVYYYNMESSTLEDKEGSNSSKSNVIHPLPSVCYIPGMVSGSGNSCLDEEEQEQREQQEGQEQEQEQQQQEQQKQKHSLSLDLNLNHLYDSNQSPRSGENISFNGNYSVLNNNKISLGGGTDSNSIFSGTGEGIKCTRRQPYIDEVEYFNTVFDGCDGVNIKSGSDINIGVGGIMGTDYNGGNENNNESKSEIQHSCLNWNVNLR